MADPQEKRMSTPQMQQMARTLLHDVNAHRASNQIADDARELGRLAREAGITPDDVRGGAREAAAQQIQLGGDKRAKFAQGLNEIGENTATLLEDVNRGAGDAKLVLDAGNLAKAFDASNIKMLPKAPVLGADAEIVANAAPQLTGRSVVGVSKKKVGNHR